ncbi:lipase 3-like [Wyeomyia smithii]|uniref:lipase 3-like n=1 Tax=Wyeomyia smithii TaxID=174621 RepID=UPI002467B891|nr:lipase 3-like [Wyeomyia smithii]
MSLLRVASFLIYAVLRCVTTQSIPGQATTADLVVSSGYPVEQHSVVTEDGYVLSIFRIPGSPVSPPIEGKPVVFLQHGILCSSTDWIIMGPGSSMAYLLADAGFDVWLGNARGNTYSRQHISGDSSTADFWNFSWHEIGMYDLPAMIDTALAKAQIETLHYIGHSQGTTAFFVMASLRPEYNQKIRTMQAFSPVAFMGNLKSPFVRTMAPFVNQIEWIMRMLGVNEFLPNSEMLALGGQKACNDASSFQGICANVLFLIAGFNSDQLNRTILPAILQHTPAGASVTQFVHYAQSVNSGRFRQFDYGMLLNLRRYGSIVPPSYPLQQISAPVFLHYGENDWLAAVSDVQQLERQLGNSAGLFRVPNDRWNHLDFTYGSEARSLLYERVIDLIRRWNDFIVK